jgi:hypothetical protein
LSLTCIRPHTSAYVSIRQHTSCSRCTCSLCSLSLTCIRQHTSAYVSIRQHTSAYVSIRQNTLRLFPLQLVVHLAEALASVFVFLY